ncbi:MAG: NAD(P)H-flavin reductase [Algicola sp.]|nr:NAD(P)H-flavin reductase [Algicola sp.]
MSVITCKVKKLEQVNDHVYHLELTTTQSFDFKAGQYLQVVMGEKDKRPFSIASTPGQTNLELHIGATEGHSYAKQVIDLCKEQGQLEVEVGLGEAQLRQDSDRPILLLAGGTGFSYVQSIARHLEQHKPDHQVLLYWGGKNLQSMYADKAMKQWQQDHKGFSYVPVIEHPDEGWQGKTGYVHLAVMEDIDNLQDYDIYIAGHFDMVKIVRDDFIAQGAVREHMFADAFAYID